MILKKSIILISRKEIQMEQGEYRPVGRLSTEGLSDVLNCMPRNWVQAPMRKP
jgi:hypothetical protein